MKKIIFRADDAGSSKSANFAIHDALMAGLLKNVSIIACADYVIHAYELFKKFSSDQVCFGLHATIACEWENPAWKPILPPSKVPLLVNQKGTFFNDFANFAKGGDELNQQIIAEISAQLDNLRNLGFKISYLDLHMCFDWIEGLRKRLIEFCEKENLVNGFYGYKSLVKEDDPKASLKESFISGLNNLNDGLYIVVTHPTCINEELKNFKPAGSHQTSLSDFISKRDQDRRFLCDSDLIELMKAKKFESIRFIDK